MYTIRLPRQAVDNRLELSLLGVEFLKLGFGLAFLVDYDVDEVLRSVVIVHVV